MKKRLTKQQREKKEIEALRVRLNDIYSGASGEEWIEDDMWPHTHILSRIHPAVISVFPVGDDKRFVYSTRNLDKFDTPSVLAEFLYRHGVRA